GNPFLGRKGLEQQLAWKEKQAAELAGEERKLLPLERAVKMLNEGWREHFDVPSGVYGGFGRAKRLPELKAELDESVVKLNRIERSKFEEMAQDQRKLEASLGEAEEDRRKLDRSDKRRQFQEAQTGLEKLRVEAEGQRGKLERAR